LERWKWRIETAERYRNGTRTYKITVEMNHREWNRGTRAFGTGEYKKMEHSNSINGTMECIILKW
jgi:hypothetical protein